MDNLTYGPEKEVEIQQLDDPHDPVYCFNNNEKTYSQKLINTVLDLQHNFHTAICKICNVSDRSAFHLNKLNSHFHIFIDKFIHECVVEKNKRLARPEKMAKQLVFDMNYPEETRLEMFSLVCKQKYDEVQEVALQYDTKYRKRPNQGKQGPSDPLSINTDQHINWNKVVENNNQNIFEKTGKIQI
ncbi:hypothetical protein LCGC14_1224890 [marine sediment metagenome]|uniref:Uncharacterized protein n=1 Tax=marine sediment metagenome TaxID=412755 RepID=A0A0F9LE90_9ZZZZ